MPPWFSAPAICFHVTLICLTLIVGSPLDRQAGFFMRACSHLGYVDRAGVVPTGKQSPSSYAGAEQEMQQRKLNGV